MRRILVGLKRVIDHGVRVHLRPDGSGVVTDGVKMSLNPFCEIALEEALRIREASRADEVVAVSLGPAEVEQQLRQALAMGADRAIRIEAEGALEPLTVARSLLAVAEREQPFLILLGKQAIDSDNNQTGQILAGLWGRPQATFASEIRLGESTVTVAREIDQGIEVLELDLPAVVTADLRLNEPRYVKLPQLLKAKKLPIETLTLTGLGIEPESQFRVIETTPPPSRTAGIRVESVDELVAILDERGLIP
ncbi:MAG TPA: electron transfer flavoprotein subunit beta/FixA family protein [Gammaproteobacteria bacterium]|nr:electron transfer flavoprotein subunit beta/FixA family protein [Gammaproteobacteria bacterium]